MSTQPQALPAAKKFSLPDLGDLAVPVSVLAIVIALITPMPSELLDFLIVVDIMMHIIMGKIYLSLMHLKRV